jgi:NADH-quinone oxidoreductase subunit G
MIIESAKRIGIEIPFFCYHPRLSMKEGGANCRMCLVEVGTAMPDGSVRKMPKPQTSCSLPATEGLVITTDSEALHEDRRGVLEFLLINHPLDCPICDRGGECPLQNNTLHYGPSTSRFIEEKRHFPKAYPLSKYVVFDRERCIHCARCTRFTRDISGDEELNFLWRGADMEVGTFDHTEFRSKFSGNVIELCPVGALLSRPYRFQARPWDIATQHSICTRCSNGCNIKIDIRQNRLARVLARENNGVNEEWTCDKGKFGMGYVSSDDRLLQPLIRKNNRFEPSTWGEAFELIVSQLKSTETHIGGIGGMKCSNEDLYIWQKFFRETLHSINLDHRMGPHFGPARNSLINRFGYPTMGNKIAQLEDMNTILVFGSELVDEQPMMYLRARKGWRFKNNQTVEAVPRSESDDGSRDHVSGFAAVSLQYKPGAELALAYGLLAVVFSKKASEPDLGELITRLRCASSLKDWSVERAASECELNPQEILKAADCLSAGSMAIITGQYVSNHPQMEEILDVLGDITVLTGNSGNLNVPVTENNQQGAMELGILPDALPGYVEIPRSGMNTSQMLQACKTGGIKTLWVVGADLITDFHDPSLAKQALESVPFLIVNELTLTETARMANVVLPVQSAAEKSGTFTNTERRVQAFYKAFDFAPDLLSDWQIFMEISSLLGSPEYYSCAGDILAEIVDRIPTFKDCTSEKLREEGAFLLPVMGGQK